MIKISVNQHFELEATKVHPLLSLHDMVFEGVKIRVLTFLAQQALSDVIIPKKYEKN